MNIYEKGTTNFSTNGLGFLTDVINASITDEINGSYILNLEYPINGHLSQYLVEGNIIKSKVADGTYQPFVISSTAKNFKTIKVTASHIFYLLLDNFLEDVYPKNLSASTFLNWILAKTQYPNLFNGFSDITDTKSARYVRKNPVESIIGADNSMINLFGGELKRDNFNIHLLSRLGTDNGVKLEIGKNITGITITTDLSGTFTRIMPVGADELVLPEKYIDSSLIDTYPYPKIGVISFDDIKYDLEDENAYQNIEDAYREMRERIRKLYQDGIDKPKINIKVDWIELSKTNEYKNYSNLEKVNLGDTIHSHVLGTDFETRVIKTTYNPLLDRIEKFEIGSAIATISSSMNSVYKKIEQINPTSILKAAKDNATNLITQAMGGYIYKTQSELYIMDTNDPTTARKVWRWNINGLGYSSTGINGPYGLAMTMDGKIVADFITTGKLDTDVIEGYNDLILKVDNFYNYTKESKGLNKVTMSNAKEGPLQELHITGNLELNYIDNDLFLEDSLYLTGTNLVVESSDKKAIVELPIDRLVQIDDVSDEFVIEQKYNEETELYESRAKIIRRIFSEYDSYLEKGNSANGKTLLFNFPEKFESPSESVSIRYLLIKFENGTIFYSHNYQYSGAYEIFFEDSDESFTNIYMYDPNFDYYEAINSLDLPSNVGKVLEIDSSIVDSNGIPLIEYILRKASEPYVKSEESIEDLGVVTIPVFEGDNDLYMEDFPSLMYDVKFVVKNNLTDNFITNAELASVRKQTETIILDEVTLQFKDVNGEVKDIKGSLELKVNVKDLISEINESADVIRLLSNRLIIESSFFKLYENGKIYSIGGTIGGFELGENEFKAELVQVSKYSYTSSDRERLLSIMNGQTVPTDEDYNKYDFNNNKEFDVLDLLTLTRIISGTYDDDKGTLIFNTNDLKNAIKIVKKNNEVVLQIGTNGSYYKQLTATSLDVVEDANFNGTTNFASVPGIRDSNSTQLVYSDGGSGFLPVNRFRGYNDHMELLYGSLTKGITWWDSDKRIKKNIKTTKENGLDTISKIKHHEFIKDGKKYKIGYIAQELEEIDKDLVFEVGEEKILNINEPVLIPYLTKAIQEQQKQIEELEKRIKVLEERID